MRDQRGQATVEWLAAVLLVATVLGGAAAVVAPAFGGRTLGGLLAHRIACAVRGGCDDGDVQLARAYGDADARLLRRHLPALVYEPGERQLPVDWRECRQPGCATAADDRDLDAHRAASGLRATVFTRIQRRGGRRYLQYWFYYPDSDTKLGPSDRVTKLPPVAAALERLGKNPYHRDDWEGYAVRIERDGRVAVRTTSHGHWQWCKQRYCRGAWGPSTGWTRVSSGSHAGHVPFRVPGAGARERSTTPAGVRLVPLEGRRPRGYRRLDPGIAPPWEKDAYRDPESPAS